MYKTNGVEFEGIETKAANQPSKRRSESGASVNPSSSLLKQYSVDNDADNPGRVSDDSSNEEACDHGDTGKSSEISDWITPNVKMYEPEVAPFEESEAEEARAESRYNVEEQAVPLLPERGRATLHRSRLLEILRPNGHWNKRLIYGALGTLLVFAMFGLGGGSKGQKKDGDNPQPAKSLKDTRDRSEALMKYSGAGEQTLGTPGAPAYPTARLSDVESASSKPPEEPPSVLARTTTAAVTPLQTRDDSSSREEPERVDEEFALVLRAGERAERRTVATEKEMERQKNSQKSIAGTSSTTATANVKDAGILPRTRIELILSEPLRSGIATSVEARVISDVKDAQGKVVIPAGSMAVVPFLAYEVNGRVISNVNEAALFVTPSGQQINLRGTAKGNDGFAGLTGKVKRIGGRSTAGRILGGITRAGTRAAADAVGDVSSEAETEINRTSYDYRLPQFERSSRIVEVASGTRFVFVVGR
jgi:hypothetical protein